MKKIKLLTLALASTFTLAGCGSEPQEEKPNPEPKKVVVDYTLDTTATEKVFAKGSTFTSEGVKVIVTYSDDSTEEITDVTVNAPNMNSVGDTEVEVAFTHDGEDLVLTYEVTITYWTTDDLDFLNEYSLVSMSGKDMPFISGMEVKYDDDWWWIERPNSTTKDVANYAKKLRNFQEVVKNFEGYGIDVHFEFEEQEEVFEGAAEYAGVDPDSALCYKVVPYYVSGSYRYPVFINDEYFVLGLDADNRMIIKNNLVDNQVSASFYNMPLDYPLDGRMIFGSLDSLFGPFNRRSTMGEYSDCAIGVLPTPDYAFEIKDQDDEEALEHEQFPFKIEDLKCIFPFDEEMTSHDISVAFSIGHSTEAERNSYLDKLLGAGFAFVETEDHDGISVDSYVFEDSYVGTFNVKVSQHADDLYIYKIDEMTTIEVPGYMILVYFDGPEVNYTREQRFVTEDILKPLFNKDASKVTWSTNTTVVTFASEGKTPVEYLQSIQATLEGNGCTVTIDEYNKTMHVSKGGYGATLVATKSSSNIRLTITGLILPPKDLTLAGFAEIMGDVFDVAFVSSDSTFVGTDDFWSTLGYGIDMATDILEQVYFDYLPDYMQVTSEGKAYTITDGPHAGVKGLDVVLTSTNGVFIVEILCYEVKTLNRVTGVNFEITLKEAN